MSSHERCFTLFPSLPIEIRFKIWRLTCPPRVIEVQLNVVPRDNDPAISEMNLDLRPLARPPLPIIFSVCQESRDEALSIYRPCVGSTFASPQPFPYNLYHPALDTLFVPISLYSIEACRPRNMFSATEALSMGTPREFILDRLAVNPGDVAAIRSLAISWADMHLKDMPTLLKALMPFNALQELSLVFFEMRQNNQEIRLMWRRRDHMKPVLVDPSESTVRGRYMKRVLEEFTGLAAAFNEGFLEMDAKRDAEGGRRRKKLPVVTIRMVRFES